MSHKMKIYTCCDCDEDMTETVLKKCDEVEVTPLIFDPFSAAGPAETIFATCTNGHTCEFLCPPTGSPE